MSEDITHRLRDVISAVEVVLVASHGPAHDLAAFHTSKGTTMPPFEFNSGELSLEEKRESAMVTALAHYGPGPLFNLWTMVRAIAQLRAAWTGQPYVRPPVIAPPPPEPSNEVAKSDTLPVEPAAPEAA